MKRRRHVMFDIDGTLVESTEVDARCYVDAVEEVTGYSLHPDWNSYTNVTDSGIIREFCQQHQIQRVKQVEKSIKNRFIANLKTAIAARPLHEIQGANSFLRTLKSKDEIIVSMATGGWLESALLKLESAAIDISNIRIASANDHHERVHIMKIAQSLAGDFPYSSCTYFGDGVWDQEACKQLHYEFIAVGQKVSHPTSIDNYLEIGSILKLLNM